MPSTLDVPGPLGPYQLRAKLGRGHQSEWYKAVLPGFAGFEKSVFIKRLHPELTSEAAYVSFCREAKLAVTAHHRNIVNVVELNRTPDGEVYIAMEDVPGVDLQQMLNELRKCQSRLPIPLVLFIGGEILDALEHLGQLRIVHGDVAPDNILLSNRGDVKLTDFGAAKDLACRETSPRDEGLGRLPYLPPEQLMGHRPHENSDVFSMGAVLWEMLTGQRLFSGDSAASIADQIHRESRPLPSMFNQEIPYELDHAITQALSTHPASRPKNARAFRCQLDRILERLTPRSQPHDLSPQLVRQVSSAFSGPRLLRLR